MGYLYEACDQISDFCHQQILRKMRRKISWTDGRTEVKQYSPLPFWGIRFLLPICRFCWFLYTFNIHLYMHIFHCIFLSNYWWQESDIWSQASYRYAILWEAFLDPSYSYFLFGVPIWSSWPNIRSLPSIVAEKNVTKNVHIQMYVKCV
jgi:hypothetical protein